MLNIIKEVELNKEMFWGGAENTFELIESVEKVEELENLINEVLGDNVEMVALNDFLRFDDEYIFDILEIEY